MCVPLTTMARTKKTCRSDSSLRAPPYARRMAVRPAVASGPAFTRKFQPFGIKAGNAPMGTQFPPHSWTPWCTCRWEEYGPMIECSLGLQGCYGWFHYPCVGFHAKWGNVPDPGTDWSCRACEIQDLIARKEPVHREYVRQGWDYDPVDGYGKNHDLPPPMDGNVPPTAVLDPNDENPSRSAPCNSIQVVDSSNESSRAGLFNGPISEPNEWNLEELQTEMSFSQ